MAQDLGSEFLVARVDGDKFDALADKFGINGYPTVKLLRKGESSPSKSEE